jgi:hypothetical protein
MPTRIGPIPDGMTVHPPLGVGWEGAFGESANCGLAAFAGLDVSTADPGFCSAVHAAVTTTTMVQSDGMRTMISRGCESAWALASTVPRAV